MEWHHPTSPRLKKFKSQQSAGKVMVTVFWDSVGVILVNFKATINSDVYNDTLKKLKAKISRVRPVLEMSKVLLQHDNTRPHTSLKTREVISSFGWTTISHSHICQTWHCLTSICWAPQKKFVRKWLKMQPVGFYNKGICAFIKRWEKVVWKAGDYIEK